MVNCGETHYLQDASSNYVKSDVFLSLIFSKKSQGENYGCGASCGRHLMCIFSIFSRAKTIDAVLIVGGILAERI